MRVRCIEMLGANRKYEDVIKDFIIWIWDRCDRKWSLDVIMRYYLNRRFYSPMISPLFYHMGNKKTPLINIYWCATFRLCVVICNAPSCNEPWIFQTWWLNWNFLRRAAVLMMMSHVKRSSLIERAVRQFQFLIWAHIREIHTRRNRPTSCPEIFRAASFSWEDHIHMKDSGLSNQHSGWKFHFKSRSLESSSTPINEGTANRIPSPRTR